MGNNIGSPVVISHFQVFRIDRFGYKAFFAGLDAAVTIFTKIVNGICQLLGIKVPVGIDIIDARVFGAGLAPGTIFTEVNNPRFSNRYKSGRCYLG
jgi:hypothetical protein